MWTFEEHVLYTRPITRLGCTDGCTDGCSGILARDRPVCAVEPRGLEPRTPTASSLADTSADLRVGVSDDQQWLVIDVECIRGGSFPIPVFFGERLASWIVDSGPKHSPRDGTLLLQGRDPLQRNRFLIRNDFLWPNGHRAFRISGASLQFHRAIVRINPE